MMNRKFFIQTAIRIFFAAIAVFFFTGRAQAQEVKNYMRIANITVDSATLESYKSALKEQMEAALKQEPGVLAYSAVYHKDKPTHITILETYASVAAYEAHIQTVHFKKYKSAVAGMVTALELIDVMPIALQSKLK